MRFGATGSCAKAIACWTRHLSIDASLNLRATHRAMRDDRDGEGDRANGKCRKGADRGREQPRSMSNPQVVERKWMSSPSFSNTLSFLWCEPVAPEVPAVNFRLETSASRRLKRTLHNFPRQENASAQETAVFMFDEGFSFATVAGIYRIGGGQQRQ